MVSLDSSPSGTLSEERTHWQSHSVTQQEGSSQSSQKPTEGQYIPRPVLMNYFNGDILNAEVTQRQMSWEGDCEW